MTPFGSRTPPALAIAACLVAALSLTVNTPAFAGGNFYRYTDTSGNPVISHTLTQEASRLGYQILNGSGRVIETVAPALTDEERTAKAALEDERRRQAELAAQRRAEDQRLLRTYSHPDDAVRALRRKLDQMRGLISLHQSSIANLQSQIHQEQSRAADIERIGAELPEQTLVRINSLETEIAGTEAKIRQQETAIAQAIAEYEAKIGRLEVLTATGRTLHLEDPDEQSGD